MFGPYGGVNIQDAEKAHASGYCWQVGKSVTLALTTLLVSGDVHIKIML